jgi:hypothetical protein
MTKVTLVLRRISLSFKRQFVLPACVRPFVKATFVIVLCILMRAQVAPQTQLPQVHLDASGLAPRPIEELTGTAVVHDYAQAWRDLADALESGSSAELGEEFVGSARDRLVRRVGEQRQAGIHVRIVDHGHNLKAVFYSSDGTAMQLVDRAQLEIQTFDGDKLLDTQNAPHDYVILMTPGADRWYVRDIEEAPAKSF